MDLSAIVVAGIGSAAGLAGLVVTRAGQRAEARQKELADRAAEEHRQFEEMKQILDIHRADRDEARQEADRERARRIEAETAADLAIEQARRSAARAVQDTAALRELVSERIAEEAIRTADAIRERETP